MIQGIALLQDLKRGQYVKLAPRMTFLMQMIGTVVGAVLNCESSSVVCINLAHLFVGTDIMMLSIINSNREGINHRP